MYKDELVYEFNDDMWYLYHEGTIDNGEDFSRESHRWIERKVIYTRECKEICNELDHNIFGKHHVFGRANDWNQAGYNAVWDLLHEHEEVLTYTKIVFENENA